LVVGRVYVLPNGSLKLRDTQMRASLLFLALALTLGACTGVPKDVVPVAPFDASRYQGQWFEIMRLDHRFERGLTNVSATYAVQKDGSVSVLNRGFDRKNCRWKEANGTAQFLGDPKTGSLAVTFFWPFAGGYHVFDLDKDYQWSMVSGPTRDYLWILARRPDLPQQQRMRLVAEAKRLGFPVSELILVDQSKPNCS
jgi:apolipoprotein D and lipocalin family protein